MGSVRIKKQRGRQPNRKTGNVEKTKKLGDGNDRQTGVGSVSETRESAIAADPEVACHACRMD